MPKYWIYSAGVSGSLGEVPHVWDGIEPFDHLSDLHEFVSESVSDFSTGTYFVVYGSEPGCGTIIEQFIIVGGRVTFYSFGKHPNRSKERWGTAVMAMARPEKTAYTLRISERELRIICAAMDWSSDKLPHYASVSEIASLRKRIDKMRSTL